MELMLHEILGATNDPRCFRLFPLDIDLAKPCLKRRTAYRSKEPIPHDEHEGLSVFYATLTAQII